MSHRMFRDSSGRLWDVWNVLPSGIERRHGDAPEPPVIERRRQSSPRMVIDERWENGWLTFQTPGEKRRLAPFPDNWPVADDLALENLCNAATTVQPMRRLIE